MNPDFSVSQVGLVGATSLSACQWARLGRPSGPNSHGRSERRGIRTAPRPASTGPEPPRSCASAATRARPPDHWTTKEIAYGITSLPPDLAGPRHLATYARQHWGIENRQHYVRDVTFREAAQKARTGSQPSAYAAIRNLVIGATRHAGFANIAHARRH